MKTKFNLHLLAGLHKSASACLFIAILSLFPHRLNAQKQFQRFYGDVYSEGFNAAVRSSDGTYVLVGGTYSGGFGSEDIFLMKTDADGNPLWLATYGGSDVEIVSDVLETQNGFVLTSTTRSFGGSTYEAMLSRSAANGTLVWQKTMSTGEHDNFRCVRKTIDGHYIVGGSVGKHACLLKVNDSGNLVWYKSFIEGGSSSAGAVIQTKDSGYALAGTQYTSAGKMNVILVRTDASGDTLWTRCFTAAGDADVYGLAETEAGNFVLSGSAGVAGSGQEMLLMQVSAGGNLLWAKTYGGAGNDYGKNLQVLPNGYVLAGQTMSFGAGVWDFVLLHTDLNGQVSWSRTYGTDKSDFANAVMPGGDGGFVVLGESYGGQIGQTDGLLVKTDASGKTPCSDTASFATATLSMTPIAFKPYSSAAPTWSSVTALTLADTFNMRIQCMSTGLKVLKQNQYGITPNPSEGPVRIELPETNCLYSIVIRNISGQTVYSSAFAGNSAVLINPQIPAGLYVIEITDGHTVLSRSKWQRL